MANLNINYAILIVFSLFISSTLINTSATKDIDQDEMCLKNEKLAKILFYVQDVSGGPNMIVHEVARANISTDAVMSFGKVYVVDVATTAAPGGVVDSEVLGKSQGIITFADKNMSASEMTFNVAFTAGKYNGSTISFAGHNMALQRRRPMPVVGGTGVFRFTRGYTYITVTSSRPGEDNFIYTVLEYTVFTTFCP